MTYKCKKLDVEHRFVLESDAWIMSKKKGVIAVRDIVNELMELFEAQEGGNYAIIVRPEYLGANEGDSFTVISLNWSGRCPICGSGRGGLLRGFHDDGTIRFR